MYSTLFSVEDVTVGLHVPDVTMCFRPPTRAHAEVSLYQDAIGVVAIYACHSGYYFADGGTVRTVLCRETVWSQDIPDCKRKSPLIWVSNTRLSGHAAAF